MTRIALSLTLAATLAACSGGDDTTDPADLGPVAKPELHCSGGGANNVPVASKTWVRTAQAGDLTVKLFTDTKLETGVTPIYLNVTTAGGQVIDDATVSFTPMMSMAATATAQAFEHTAPVLGTPTFGSDLYAVDTVFQMPSSMMGSWWAKASVMRPGMEAPAVANFDSFEVTDSGCAAVFMYPPSATTEPQTRYVMTVEFVSPPKIGLNPVILTLHTRETMMSFPPVEDATFALDPQMPSMGHGSSGNVDPTPVAGMPGVYEGVIGFSMAGEWETMITVRDGGAAVAAAKVVTVFH